MTEQELGPVGWSNAPLEIVSDAPLADHLEHALDDRDVDALEASGVHVDGQHAYVVFDNTEFVARVTLPLSRGSGRDAIIDVSSARRPRRRLRGHHVGRGERTMAAARRSGETLR